MCSSFFDPQASWDQHNQKLETNCPSQKQTLVRSPLLCTMLKAVSVTERAVFVHSDSEGSSSCPFISPYKIRKNGNQLPLKRNKCVCVHSEPKKPTGKLDFLSNLWALVPSRAWGHGGTSVCRESSTCFSQEFLRKKNVKGFSTEGRSTVFGTLKRGAWIEAEKLSWLDSLPRAGGKINLI